MRLADVVVLYTDEEAQEFIRSGFEVHRVFALNNTIDTSGIEAARKQWDEERLAAFRSESGINGKKLLLFCGRLHSRARLELALDAVAILRASDSRWMLVVIGSGEEEARLYEYAGKKGLQGAVRWLGPIYDAAEQAPWFLSAQCFLYPGGVGLSLMNSFAFGLPVITHDDVRTQMPEIAALVDGDNGMLFRAGDAVDLVRKIQKLDSDEAVRDRMSRNAMETIASRFSLENMVNRFITAMEATNAT
jgi:glycosyltransferase involved in cell wall biosynthesis